MERHSLSVDFNEQYLFFSTYKMKFLFASVLLSAALLVASFPVESDEDRANTAKWESFKVIYKKSYLLKNLLKSFERILYLSLWEIPFKFSISLPMGNSTRQERSWSVRPNFTQLMP